MRSVRTVVLAALVLVALGVLGWLARPRGDGAPTGAVPGAPAAAESTPSSLRIVPPSESSSSPACDVLPSGEAEPTRTSEAKEPALAPATPRLPIVIHGRLVEAETGAPVAGTIEIDQGDHGTRIDTGPDGVFRFQITTRVPELASARAPGRALTMFAVRPGHEYPGYPLVVALHRAATLDARVLDSAGTPIPGADVELTTDSHHLVLPDAPMLDSSLDDPPRWSGRTDAHGRARVTDLVPYVPLRLCTRAERFRPRAEAYPIELLPGEVRPIEIRLGAGAETTGTPLRGGVLDSGGAIVVDVVDASTGERCACELSLTRAEPWSWTGTGSHDGRIGFEALVPGSYTIGAWTPDGRVGIVRGIDVEPGATREDVRVEVRPGVKLELRYEGPGSSAQCRIVVGGVRLRIVAVEKSRPTEVFVPPGDVEVRWSDADEPARERIETTRVTEAQPATITLRAGE